MCLCLIIFDICIVYKNTLTLLCSQTLGFVVLGGVEVRALNVTGLVINTAGGVWYSYAKYRLKNAKNTKNKTPSLESNVEAYRK